jgi:hypothetical protein
MRAFIRELVGRQPLHDAAVGVDEYLARLIVLDLVILELEGRNAAADADLGAAVGQVIEHADLVDHSQRRIERQEIDQRPHLDLFGEPRDRA